MVINRNANLNAIKRVLLRAASLLILLSAALHAQSITGAWQATLPAPASQRIVIKIDKPPDGILHGGLIHIDTGPEGLPLTNVVLAGSDVTIEQAFGGVSFKGKLSPDGKSIDGTWTQFQKTLPLTLTLATPQTLWHYDGPALPGPMSPTADPSFEVAIIKLSSPDENGVRFDLRARKFTANWCSAKELIKIAYYVRGKQVPGGPSWTEDEKFDVTAEPDTPGIPSEQQNRDMVRKLLEDRFQLKVHTSQKEFPALAVTLDKNINLNAPALHPVDPQINGHGIYFARVTPDSNVLFQYAGVTFKQFVGLIMNIYQANLLVDETGNTATYDITLSVPLSDLQGGTVSGPEDQGNALIDAAKRIGFRFTPKKESLPIIVVDHIEKPSPN